MINQTKKTWITHASIWTIYLILLIWLYNEARGFEFSVSRSFFIVGIQVIIFYMNYYILLPRFFENKQYSKYVLFVLATLLVSLLLFFLFDKLNFEIQFKKALLEDDFSRLPRDFRGRGRSGHGSPWNSPWKFAFIWRTMLFNGFFILISLFISTILRNLVVNQRKEKESLYLQSQVREAESRMLKSQINPHFLFNTLNNIYSMAQLKSDKTPDAVHQLSEMLRYVIYDCNDQFVKLGQELKYIRSYIELQLLKDDEMQNVNFEMDHVNPELKIAPMLLIPFVENSFKHSHFEDTKNSRIDITLQTNNQTLTFNIANSIPVTEIKKDTTGGVGMENVRRRLDLIYPGRHKLTIEKNSREYKIELSIELNEN